MTHHDILYNVETGRTWRNRNDEENGLCSDGIFHPYVAYASGIGRLGGRQPEGPAFFRRPGRIHGHRSDFVRSFSQDGLRDNGRGSRYEFRYPNGRQRREGRPGGSGGRARTRLQPRHDTRERRRNESRGLRFRRRRPGDPILGRPERAARGDDLVQTLHRGLPSPRAEGTP